MTKGSGEVIARFEMTVERGKIREFARATGSTNRADLREALPPVPPTSLTSAVFWQPASANRPQEALGMDLRRVLHGEPEFRFYGPPVRAGSTLSVEVRIESVEHAEWDGPDLGRICVEISLSMARGVGTVASGSACFAVDDLASLGSIVSGRRG